MAPPSEPHSRAMWSKNKLFHENAVTGIEWSCMLPLIGSCHHIFSINASSTFNISGINVLSPPKRMQPQLLKLFHWLFMPLIFFVEILLNNSCSGIGEARIFQRGGGHIVSKWGYSFIWTFSSWNVIAFSPPVLSFSVKEAKACKWGGHGHPRTPCLRPWRRLYCGVKGTFACLNKGFNQQILTYKQHMKNTEAKYVFIEEVVITDQYQGYV